MLQRVAPKLVTELAGEPVVELVVVIHVRERVPLCRGLQGHHDVVVVEPHRCPCRRCRRSSRPRRDPIPARAPRSRRASPPSTVIRWIGLRPERCHPALRSLAVEVHPEGEELALLHHRRRRPDLLRGDEVQRAELVVSPPPAPVRGRGRRRGGIPSIDAVNAASS